MPMTSGHRHAASYPDARRSSSVPRFVSSITHSVADECLPARSPTKAPPGRGGRLCNCTAILCAFAPLREGFHLRFCLTRAPRFLPRRRWAGRGLVKVAGQPSVECGFISVAILLRFRMANEEWGGGLEALSIFKERLCVPCTLKALSRFAKQQLS